MRLMAYNILDGGRGRIDPLAEVIRHVAPDVAVCPEADSKEDFRALAQRLGMHAFWAAPVDSHGLGVLSRSVFDAAVSHSRPPLDRACAEVQLVTPGGKTLTVFGLHLSPHITLERENVRVEQVGFLLDRTAELRAQGRPHVLMGDFNATRPGQKLDPPTMRENDRKRLAAQHGLVPTHAIAAILDAGYIDAFQAVHGEDEPGLTMSTQTPSLRVDYIFLSGDLAGRLKNAGVHYERLARYASDHWPLWADLDI